MTMFITGGASSIGRILVQELSARGMPMRVLIRQIKHAADLLAFEFAAQGLPVKIVYPGFGYGCSQATSHPSLHEQTLLRMAAGKPVAIMGSGKNRLSFLESIRATWLDYQQQGWSS